VLPPIVVDGAARAAGFGAAHISPARRAQVERNLRRVYGPDFRGAALRRAVDETFESYARYWAESFRLPGTSQAVLDAGMELEGLEHLQASVERGRGSLLTIPHLGGWEWAGFWEVRTLGHPKTVVVEMLDPPELFEWFAELRRSFGMNIVPLGPDAGGELIRAIKANHIVCLLCDRDIGGGGVEVEFFGERTRLPAGPATLALRTGATLLPTAAYFKGRGHLGVCRPPIPVEREGTLREDVTRITQLVAHELEELIRVAPEQWHLMQPNWPSDYQAAENGAVP
jgi:KDO2-lipid IV(A) lauroyltransferase